MIFLPAFIRDHKKLFLVLFVFLLAGVALFLRNGDDSSGYVMGTVQKMDITQIVAESGVVVADGSLPIYSPTHGFVTQVFIQNGAAVKKGDKLFSVQSSASEEQKQAAYASYLGAKATHAADSASLYTLQSQMLDAWKSYTDLSQNATYQNADKSPNVGNRTAAEFISSQSRWRAAEDAYKNQQNVLSKDKAAMQSAWNTYQATQNSTVVSPLDGFIANLSVEKGNSVEALTVLTAGAQPVLLIINSNKPAYVLAVGQNNISKVEVGQSVVITPDADKEALYNGTVQRVDSLGTNMQGVTVFNVYVEPEGEASLKAGMTFDAEITTQKIPDALAVPKSAVVVEKGVTSVRKKVNGSIALIPVRIGMKGQTHTQILEGLSEGEEIVVALTNEKAQRPGFLGL